jgi:hypothetical protein
MVVPKEFLWESRMVENLAEQWVFPLVELMADWKGF